LGYSTVCSFRRSVIRRSLIRRTLIHLSVIRRSVILTWVIYEVQYFRPSVICRLVILPLEILRSVSLPDLQQHNQEILKYRISLPDELEVFHNGGLGQEILPDGTIFFQTKWTRRQ
jgi:hypothetical protein